MNSIPSLGRFILGCAALAALPFAPLSMGQTPPSPPPQYPNYPSETPATLEPSPRASTTSGAT